MFIPEKPNFNPQLKNKLHNKFEKQSKMKMTYKPQSKNNLRLSIKNT